MCTVTILTNTNKVVITMNRDEAKNRLPETPPKLVEDLIYPIDKNSGGTWITANKKGEVACLLNRYDKIDETKSFNSRGVIVREFLLNKELLTKESLEQFRPFSLVYYSKESVIKFDYDGENLSKRTMKIQNKSEDYHFTSSSYNWDKTLRFREEQFNAWKRDQGFIGTIPSIHLEQIKGRENISTLMERENNNTKSITQFVVNFEDKQLEVNYHPEPRNLKNIFKEYYELDL